METPPDPHQNPSSDTGLEDFEAALAAAAAAIEGASTRADAVLKGGKKAPEPESAPEPEVAPIPDQVPSPEPAPVPELEMSADELIRDEADSPTEIFMSRGDIGSEGGISSPLMGDLVSERLAESEGRQPGDEGETVLPRPKQPAKRSRLGLSTVLFSIATAASRIAGLAREVVAASYFGISGPMSAFTIAFQVPNLVRALFADAALQPAFVPIFTEQIEEGKFKEAFRMASTMLLLVTMVLGAITAIFVLFAGTIMPLFAPGFSGYIEHLMIVLSQIMFPILILLGLTGVVVGILNSYDRFSAFAISPLFWNLAIITTLVVLTPRFPEDQQIYAYAIGVLIGTVVQLLIPTWDLRHTPFKFTFKVDFKDPNVRRVLLLMIPVTLSLGLINFNLLVNSFFGSLVGDDAPAAIDKAFRIYQLPQGIFSVAIATVLFPTLARFATRGDYKNLRETLGKGMRQIVFVLLPATAAILVLSQPMIQLIYQRGQFDAAETDLVATALFWFALSLPTNGMYLLLSRTFFGLQKPWIPTFISLSDLTINAIFSWILYKPFGVAGIVGATAIATSISVTVQVIILRGKLGGIEATAFISTTLRVLVGSAVLALVSYEAWDLLDATLGESLVSQIVSLGVGLGLGGIAYVAVCQLLKVSELDQILAVVRRRRA